MVPCCAMQKLYDTLNGAFHRSSHPAYRWVEGTIWGLIVASIGLFVVELVLGPDDPWVPVLLIVDWVVLGLFALEISLRILSFKPAVLGVYEFSFLGKLKVHLLGRLGFCFRPMTLIDLLTVLALIPALRGLRALRLLRLLRTVELFRYSNPFLGMARAFSENRLLFIFAFSMLGTATLLGGVTIFLTDKGIPGSKIHSLADGFWWALVTLTTVGYGDITPMSWQGKIIGAAMMVAGMFSLALFAGIVGRTLVTTVLSIREEEIRMSNYLDHLVVCGYEPESRMLLDTIMAELDMELHQPVVFGSGERPQDIPNDFAWVSGDPTKESELEKARVSHAAAVIVVGSRQSSPQQADAKTILTIFTIRSWMTRHANRHRRSKPLYIVVEILDSENVQHAKAAGADEVIETRLLGFSMLSHAISIHGSASVISRVMTVGAQNLYVGAWPSHIKGPINFGALRAKVRKHSWALVIGVRKPDGTKEYVNPEDDFVVEQDMLLIYLAESPILPDA